MARGKYSKYTDSQGRFLTKSLFVETIMPEQSGRGLIPTYTLNGHPGFIDIGELYLEMGDPTGYEFAKAAFESWEHFKHLSKLSWFKRHLDMWHDELEVRMRSQAIVSLHNVATTQGNRGITAAKYIAERGWEKKRGRPSKAEVEREKKQQARIDQEIDEDASRLSVH